MNMPKKGANRAPNGGNGRPKGALNRTTVAVKEAIQKVADDLGGPERMLEWVKEDPLNERIFWKDIYPKLLPLQLSTGDGALSVIVKDYTGRTRGDDAED